MVRVLISPLANGENDWIGSITYSLRSSIFTSFVSGILQRANDMLSFIDRARLPPLHWWHSGLSLLLRYCRWGAVEAKTKHRDHIDNLCNWSNVKDKRQCSEYAHYLRGLHLCLGRRFERLYRRSAGQMNRIHGILLDSVQFMALISYDADAHC